MSMVQIDDGVSGVVQDGGGGGGAAAAAAVRGASAVRLHVPRDGRQVSTLVAGRRVSGAV